MTTTKSKFDVLKSDLSSYVQNGLIVAFSGGIDSAFLLWAAHEAVPEHDGNLLALTTVSPSVPRKDIVDAQTFARKVGVEHLLVNSDEFEKEGYLQNAGLRCYHCKSSLFDIARKTAESRGIKHIAYGYNASDFGDVRPGHQAAIENNILYPLATNGFTKDEIRGMLEEQGFQLSDKPASPCLSSRLMTGVRVSPDKLQDIESLETMLRNRGLRVFRVRFHQEDDIKFLRLEIDPAEMEKILEIRDDFVREAKSRGFRWVTLDLDGYKTGGAVK